jgi:thiol-disulfide isomerase/thioredoxin
MPIRLRKTIKNRNRNKNKTINKRPKYKVITAGLIYAEWCGHCQALKPHWDKMKNNMKNKNTHFIEIEDSDKLKEYKINKINKSVKNKLVVNGFPTVFRIKGGNLEYYEGERTTESMQKWFSFENKNQQQEQQNLGFYPKLQRLITGGCGCSNTVKI